MSINDSPILVVDDDEMCCRIIADILQRAGYEVEATTDAFVAVSWARRRSYALIVSDVGMPELSGTALVAEIRRTMPEMPVILVTAFPDPTTQAKARALRVPLLAKPFETKDIVALVGQLLLAEKNGAAARD